MSPRLERGVFTLSFDFELVWGSRDIIDPVEPLLEEARRTRQDVFEPMVRLLAETGVHATWATVGHLFLDQAYKVGGVLHPDVVPARHPWRRVPWFVGVPQGTEAEHPEFYGRSLVMRLVEEGHEVGSHSFSHPIFSDPGCSRQTADTELARCVAEASKLGITLRSFVFPRNEVGHLDLLARHGFTCWRGPAPSWYDQPGLLRRAGRLAHLVDVARAGEPPTVLPRPSAHGLWNIPASASFLPVHGVRRHIPVRQRVLRCIKGLDAAVRDGRIFHLWTHPINLANDPDTLISAFGEVFQHAQRLVQAGDLEVQTMGQLADRAARKAAAA